MKTVSILLLNQLNIGGLENARQGFLESNNYLRMMGKSPAFNVELVGSDKEVKVDEGLYAIRAQKNIRELSKTDIIVIPPIKGDKIQEAIEQNLAFLPWIVDQYHKGAEVVSLCLGAFILGASGLVDNKNCVTHWRAADQFRKHFPKTHLLTDKILTDEERIYTGGGAFSSANLVLYLIEKMVDRETAVYCSKHFQIDMSRVSQSPFIIFKGQRNHEDKLIKQAQDFIEQNYQGEFTVDQLATQLFVNRRTLERRFKKATGNTLSEYMQRVRVEVAKRNFEQAPFPVKEVMYKVGYSDAKSFRKLFKKHVGLSPIEYKKRYAS
ncbi:MAG: AraC family transcriptional regulator [Flavobacteriales bacterium]|nr:AraC family transcriptional regulator [Flavobacteriales bacterium]|tara:strand:+ start:2681 stop:3649 length:969 start_codon:yes stop_codon:yes gene_type:complete